MEKMKDNKKILLSLSNKDLKALDSLAKESEKSRSQVLREAVKFYLASTRSGG